MEIMKYKNSGEIKYPLFYFALLLLLSASLKDDLGAIETNIFWSDLAVSPIVAALKSYSYQLAIIGLCCGGYFILMEKAFSIKRNRISFFFIVLWGFAVLRIYINDENLAFRFLISFVLYLFIFYVLSAAIELYGIKLVKFNFAIAMYVFSLIFVLTNFLNLLSGYGFVPGNPRFFGTSIHPNFIGVQLAICNIILLASVVGGWRFYGYIGVAISIFVLVVGVVSQLATGSRTALLILIFGMMLIFYRKNKLIFYVLAIAVSLIASILIIYIANDVFGVAESFFRGVGQSDTRTEAWYSMLKNIESAPLFGLGVFQGFSESSYLRLMVVFGVPYGILMIALLTILIVHHFKMDALAENYFHQKNLFIALTAGLSIGAFFEGYLTDLWSLPKLMFVFLVGLFFRSSYFRGRFF